MGWNIIGLLEGYFDAEHSFDETFFSTDSQYETDIMIDNVRVLDLIEPKVNNLKYEDIVFVSGEQTFTARISGRRYSYPKSVEFDEDPIMPQFSIEKFLGSDPFLYTYLRMDYSGDIPDDICGQIRLFLYHKEKLYDEEVLQTTWCKDTAKDWVDESELELEWQRK